MKHYTAIVWIDLTSYTTGSMCFREYWPLADQRGYSKCISFNCCYRSHTVVEGIVNSFTVLQIRLPCFRNNNA